MYCYHDRPVNVSVVWRLVLIGVTYITLLTRRYSILLNITELYTPFRFWPLNYVINNEKSRSVNCNGQSSQKVKISNREERWVTITNNMLSWGTINHVIYWRWTTRNVHERYSPSFNGSAKKVSFYKQSFINSKNKFLLRFSQKVCCYWFLNNIFLENIE